MLLHLDARKSMGSDGIPPRLLMELAEVLTKPLSISCQLSWLSSRLVASKCDAHLQEGPEGGSKELQACQSDLGAGEAHGADYLECHHMALRGQPGDQTQSARVYQRQVLIDKPDLLLGQGDALSG